MISMLQDVTIDERLGDIIFDFRLFNNRTKPH